MSNITCPQCGGEISGKSGAAVYVCGDCGANVPLTIEKGVVGGESAPAPKTKKRLVYAAIFLFLLSLPLLFFGGLYWVVVRQSERSADYSIRPPDRIRPKPTARPKKNASISASEITRIEYADTKHRKPEYAGAYLSNYALKNSFHRESVVSFDDDGRATKFFLQQETVNGVGTPQRLERHTGAFAPEQFAELAEFFAENDFTGEEESNTSTVSPINQKLTVFYSAQQSKSFQAGISDSDTPEAAAMLKAFRELENKINWQRVE